MMEDVANWEQDLAINCLVSWVNSQLIAKSYPIYIIGQDIDCVSYTLGIIEAAVMIHLCLN